MEIFISRFIGPAPELYHEYPQDQTPSPQEPGFEPDEPEPEESEETDQTEDADGDEEEEMLFDDDGDYDNEAVLSEEQVAHCDLIFSGSAYRSKRPVPVLEISSSLSGAGKSQMVYYLTVLAVLPWNYGDLHIGGQDAAVVFIDTDDRFDIQRLREIAWNIIQQAQETTHQTEEQAGTLELSDDDIEAMIIASFKHIHLFRPNSSSALLATLAELGKYLYDVSRHHSASRPLHMLAIDSMTAFFWQDKLRDALARADDLERSKEENDKLREQKQSFYFADLYAEIATELKRLQGRFGCTVVYTTTLSGFRPNKTPAEQNRPMGPYDAPPSNTPALRPVLPAPWGTFTLLRLVVQRDPVRAFLPTMSINDAKRDAPMRQSIVSQGKFSAYVNAWGREDWPSRVIDGLKPYGDGSFVFYVREDGVMIPLPDS